LDPAWRAFARRKFHSLERNTCVIEHDLFELQNSSEDAINNDRVFRYPERPFKNSTNVKEVDLFQRKRAKDKRQTRPELKECFRENYSQKIRTRRKKQIRQ